MTRVNKCRRLTYLSLTALIPLLWLGSAQSTSQSSRSASAQPELVIQTGHSYRVNCVAFGPNDLWLASGGADKIIKIWEVSSGHELRALIGHSGWIKALAVSRNGEWLASGSNDRSIKIWNVSTGQERQTLRGHEGSVDALAFSHDDRLLVSGSSDNTLKIWDVTTGQERQTLRGHTGWITTLAFSPDSTLVASGSLDRTVKVWKTSSWAESHTLRKHTSSISSLAFSSDGAWLATASADGEIFVWPKAESHERYKLKGSSAILALNFRSPAELLSSAKDGTVAVWDNKRGNLTRVLPSSRDEQELLLSSFSRDGRTLATSIGNPVIDLTSVATGAVTRVMESHAATFNAVAFSDNGKLLASGTNDRSVRLWQVSTGRELPRLTAHRGWVSSISFSSDSRLIATGSNSGEVKVWEVSTGRELHSLVPIRGGIHSVAFSPDGKFVASAGVDLTIRVWEFASGGSTSLTGHSEQVTSISWHPNSSLLASAGIDKTIRMWDPNTGALVKTLVTMPDQINALAFARDGLSLFAGTANNRVVQVDKETGSELRIMLGHSGEILTLAPSRDGDWLASGSADGTVTVWDAKLAKPVYVLRAASGSVNSVAFNPDDEWLLSGSDDGSALLWKTSDGSLTASLISTSNSDEWLVVTPDGLFDGSPAAWSRILWRFDKNTFKVAPIESFFNEFYYPGLLAEILAGKSPRAVVQILNKDRRQPQITLALAEAQSPGDKLSVREVKIRLEAIDAPPDESHSTGSGVHDLRLFRNGLLVKAWPGDALKGANRYAVEASVPIVAGENRFTAYGFNRDNVKTLDANLSVTGADSLSRVGTAYIVAIGVGRYANTQYNLNYSVADAVAMSEQLKDQQERLGRYRPVEVITLLDDEATKANILHVLKRLSGRESGPLPPNSPAVVSRIKAAQPEDAVLIYFSGHGTAQKDRFYLIPHDIGYEGSRTQLDDKGLQSILAHSVSDVELEEALRPLDADQLLLVIDACNSGQALEAEEKRRGPMNTKGLAQLAYEKGMYVLTASQSIEVAFESEALKHSYLAYALVEESIKAGAGDADRNGELILREWFDYATYRVPRIRIGKGRTGKILEEDDPDERRIQRPRVFYTRESGAQGFVVARFPGGRTSATPPL